MLNLRILHTRRQLNFTFTDTVFLVASSATAAAALPACGVWISVACSPLAQVHQWAVHVMISSVSVTVRCHGLLQLSSLMVINTWPAHYNCTGCIHIGCMQHQHHHGWAAVASLPSLCVRDAARTTFQDQDMSSARFPLGHFPWQPLLKLTRC